MKKCEHSDISIKDNSSIKLGHLTQLSSYVLVVKIKMSIWRWMVMWRKDTRKNTKGQHKKKNVSKSTKWHCNKWNKSYVMFCSVLFCSILLFSSCHFWWTQFEQNDNRPMLQQFVLMEVLLWSSTYCCI